MHELALAQSIVEIASRHAQQQSATAVTRVQVVLGRLSCASSEAVEFCFAATCRGTLLEGATLQIEQPTGLGRCRHCGVEFSVAQRYAPCPQCGGFDVEIRRGDELLVKAIEITN